MYKKMILIATVLIFFMACGSENNEKKIRNDIAKYKEKIVSLQSKIIALEVKLKNNSKNISDQGIHVKVKKIKRERFEHFFTTNASIEAVNEAFISPEVPGQIDKILVKEGSRVKRGDLLIELNSNIIDSTISELKISLKLAGVIFKKRNDLWAKKIGSEVQFLEAKNSVESLQQKLDTLNEQLKLYKIKAPFGGIVDNISKKRGEMASPGMPLMFIVNLKKVYVVSDVSEMYISRLHRGDEAEISFPSLPGIKRKGKIYLTGTVVNPQNRTFKIKILLDNSNETLKPNMIAEIKLRDFVDENAISVPSIIVKNDIKGTFLYKVSEKNGDKIAKKTYVETGMSSGGDLIIKKGLSENDLLITKGYSLVKNGSKIKIVK